MSNTTEQLLALKALTRTTGCLHEAQILQLKMWPYLLFPKNKIKYEIHIDQEKDSVEYALVFDGKTPKDIAKRMGKLEVDFQWLLGEDWLLTASVGKKQVFKGTRKVRSANAIEKKAQTPFITAINSYIERDWSKK